MHFKSAKLFMTYAVGKLEAALNIILIILIILLIIILILEFR